MAKLLIKLPESLAAFVAVQGAAEGYASASDYVLDLVRQAQRAKRRARFEAKIQEGLDSLNRGEGQPWTAAELDRLRAEIRAKYGEGDEPWPST
jgi:Arc/MetJ-type ribon-helix-helix transcriptional regulator